MIQYSKMPGKCNIIRYDSSDARSMRLSEERAYFFS